MNEPAIEPIPDWLDGMFEQLYDELKREARRVRARAPLAGSEATTQLVHDLYLKLRHARDQRGPVEFPSRGHFFAYAAKAMRTIMIDHARSAGARRARDDAHADAHADGLVAGLCGHTLSPVSGSAIDLERALAGLRAVDERAASVVDLHLFLDLPLPEIASLLDASPRTVDRDWRFARAFLTDALRAKS